MYCTVGSSFQSVCPVLYRQAPSTTRNRWLRVPAVSFKEEPPQVQSLDTVRTRTTGVGDAWVQRLTAEGQLHSTTQHRLIVGVSFGLNFWILGRVLLHVGSWGEAVGVLGAVYGGYVVADLLSGIYHWSIDNYGSKDTPVFGKQIQGFQEHHQHPPTITYRQFCNNVHPICVSAIPFSALVLLLHPGTVVEVFTSIGCMLVVLSQQFHAWAHTNKSQQPRWVQRLQQAGVLVSTKMHCQHHRPPYDINYCIVSGVCNPFLDRHAIFHNLETFIHNRTGVEPRSWTDPNEEQAVQYFDDDTT